MNKFEDLNFVAKEKMVNTNDFYKAFFLLPLF